METIVSDKLAKYLKRMVEQGYHIKDLRPSLKEHGWTDKDIDKAIRSVFKETKQKELNEEIDFIENRLYRPTKGKKSLPPEPNDKHKEKLRDLEFPIAVYALVLAVVCFALSFVSVNDDPFFFTYLVIITIASIHLPLSLGSYRFTTVVMSLVTTHILLYFILLTSLLFSVKNTLQQIIGEPEAYLGLFVFTFMCSFVLASIIWTLKSKKNPFATKHISWIKLIEGFSWKTYFHDLHFNYLIFFVLSLITTLLVFASDLSSGFMVVLIALKLSVIVALILHFKNHQQHNVLDILLGVIIAGFCAMFFVILYTAVLGFGILPVVISLMGVKALHHLLIFALWLPLSILIFEYAFMFFFAKIIRNTLPQGDLSDFIKFKHIPFKLLNFFHFEKKKLKIDYKHTAEYEIIQLLIFVSVVLLAGCFLGLQMTDKLSQAFDQSPLRDEIYYEAYGQKVLEANNLSLEYQTIATHAVEREVSLQQFSDVVVKNNNVEHLYYDCHANDYVCTSSPVTNVFPLASDYYEQALVSTNEGGQPVLVFLDNLPPEDAISIYFDELEEKERLVNAPIVEWLKDATIETQRSYHHYTLTLPGLETRQEKVLFYLQGGLFDTFATHISKVAWVGLRIGILHHFTEIAEHELTQDLPLQEDVEAQKKINEELQSLTSLQSGGTYNLNKDLFGSAFGPAGFDVLVRPLITQSDFYVSFKEISRELVTTQSEVYDGLLKEITVTIPEGAQSALIREKVITELLVGKRLSSSCDTLCQAELARITHNPELCDSLQHENNDAFSDCVNKAEQ